MNTIPMFDVLPVTGPGRGQGRVCYVCKLGSAPVVVLFIKPQVMASSPLPTAIQKLSDAHAQLQAFIVCLGEPSDAQAVTIRKLAADQQLEIPLVQLPDGVLPPSFPVDPTADSTIVFYRGRQLAQKFENMDSLLLGNVLLMLHSAAQNIVDQL